jgi:hypothetical protein
MDTPNPTDSIAPLASGAADAGARAAKPLVVVTEHLADEASEWLAKRFEVIHAAPTCPRFAEAAADIEALVVRTYTRVDEQLLAGLPRLKVVGRAGVGIDNIDVAACRARGVQVVSTPDANTQAVVEYVVCLLCDALRPRLFLDEAVTKQEWDELRQDVVGLWQMDELVLGILHPLPLPFGFMREALRFVGVMFAVAGGAWYFCWMKKTTPISTGIRLMEVRWTIQRLTSNGSGMKRSCALRSPRNGHPPIFWKTPKNAGCWRSSNAK